ncbi:MAG TPA: peptidylprolyl isomerase [Methylomirabilota bacterium]|jgi:cyclophilin family peptidyl-prolyl cis-trans isomerase|nr:peptidylprolyl isomerase [Methylomirabilota bacterium]
MTRTPRPRRLFVPLALAALLPLLLAAAPAKPARPRVLLDTVCGPIVIELHPEDAPQTVANFTKLVKEGYYDSLSFHRVAPGFVIQGGDPNSKNANPFDDGQGGPGYTVPAEIKAKHVKGAVAAARKSDQVNPERASSGSQFYICLDDLTQLDGAYTVFGQVVSGWPAIDSIVGFAKRDDIARQGNNWNPGTLAMIKHARLLPADKAKAAKPDSTNATVR